MTSRFNIDPFVLRLLAAIALASLFPAHGVGVPIFGWATNLAIALLFFLHGARLSREAVVAGMSHWRLHLSILSVTFVVFPVLGLVLGLLAAPLLTPDLYTGVVFLCCLPGTVQSAIAFTSIARGNVPAAICSASASTLLGVFLTPLLVGLILAGAGSAAGGLSLDAIGKIMLQLLVPFVLGQAARPWIGGWAVRNKRALKVVDQGSILLVVYTAFSNAVTAGLWQHTPLSALASLAGLSAILLALVMAVALGMGRIFGFSAPDRITLLFCGSKKSLSSGIPIANILFAGHAVGAIVLPIMIFHQIQLFVCALIAGRYARRPEGPASRALNPSRT
ncbi:bile acid:sodium symporter [Allopusillimonas soli]|uniref:Bile acid:sodium symporter n=1 Tax=Allopusillimonas soli TaxID=659016 RepID=A0A853FJ52_9BURK|nr:bile acid:sodium symporter family protein [Allopusillimonas soli]NYT38441.1 bile acid:sodium symporter [Allopusillimonas soli]TEA72004.1 bile acid:sodium symporter [Allopusillimonas soli]